MWALLTVVWLPGGPGGLGGQHVAPAPKGETDRSHECPRGDEVPQSEEVRLLVWWWDWAGLETPTLWVLARDFLVLNAGLRVALEVRDWAPPPPCSWTTVLT